MKNYTTLFDHRYLAQGIVLLKSLSHFHSREPFHIFVLCMDAPTFAALARLNLPNVYITTHQEFEATVKTYALQRTRTRQEYFWTCGSLWTDHILRGADLNNITYLDADMMFYSDPSIIHQEIQYGNGQIGVIPHRFSPAYEKRFGGNGRFNVCWVTFNNIVGRECLKRWAEQCREWCYYRQEPGRFGDQGYLDEWPDLYYPHVHEISNPGAGLAPWNISNYDIAVQNDTQQICVAEKVSGQAPPIYTPLVFYHFHQYVHGGKRTLHRLPPDADLIYKPYEEAVEKASAYVPVAR
jgi:hypothetical protein